MAIQLWHVRTTDDGVAIAVRLAGDKCTPPSRAKGVSEAAYRRDGHVVHCYAATIEEAAYIAQAYVNARNAGMPSWEAEAAIRQSCFMPAYSEGTESLSNVPEETRS